MKRVIFLCLVIVLLVWRSAFAQDYNTTEGISGTVDKKRRNPVVSVGTKFGSGSVSILADAFVPHDEYKEYPLQFDFFVNRALYASQIRSTELPGPVGVVVPNSVAPTPFNYSVVVKVLHPNRTFTTVLNGSATTATADNSLNCNVVTLDLEGNTVTYTASAVSAPTVTDSAYTISFTGTSSSGDAAINLQASTGSDGSTGTLTIDGEESSLEGSTVTSEDKVSSLSMTGTEEDIEISCS